MSKPLSNGSKIQFQVNKCIVGDANNDVVIIAQCEENVYQITFIEVCGANAANFVRSRTEGGVAEL